MADDQPLVRPEEIKDSSEPPLPPPDPGLKEEFERLRKLQAQIEAERKQKMGEAATPPKVETITPVPPPPATPQPPVSPPASKEISSPPAERGEEGRERESTGEESQPKSRFWLAVVGILILGVLLGGGVYILRSNQQAKNNVPVFHFHTYCRQKLLPGTSLYGRRYQAIPAVQGR